MFCRAIQSCTTEEKCDVAISEKFPTGMPTRPECPEGQVCTCGNVLYFCVLENNHESLLVGNLNDEWFRRIII